MNHEQLFGPSMRQPARTLVWLWFAGFVIVLVGGFLLRWDVDHFFRYWFGTLAVLLGLTLALDVNLVTTDYMHKMRTRTFFGVDYSKSPFATVTYGRVTGVGFVIIGTLFLVGFGQ